MRSPSVQRVLHAHHVASAFQTLQTLQTLGMVAVWHPRSVNAAHGAPTQPSVRHAFFFAMSVPSYGNKNNYMTLVDDYTRATWVYFLKQKSDAPAAIKDFVAMCERQHGKVLRFRTDNGGEYVNKELEDFFAETGILHDPTPPYSHESNGVAERLNRTLFTMARCMTCDVKDQRLWAEAIQTAVYLKNRLLEL
jgi:transposase InsO family protein